MSDNINLSLRFDEAGECDSEGGMEPVARVFVDSACSYLKDSGASVISVDCGSIREFETEVKRLKNEIDAILDEARRRFEGRGVEAPVRTGESPQQEQNHPKGAVEPSLSIHDDLRVRDRMTRDVETLKPNDKVMTAEELMKAGSFRHVVVVNEAETEVIGLLSHSDICFSALAWNLGEGRTAHDRILGQLPVKQVMQNVVTTVSPDARVTEAARMMAEKKIGCLPVTENDRLVGIVTTGDILAMVTGAQYDGVDGEGGGD